jgi:flagellar M-ring protein FliF
VQQLLNVWTALDLRRQIIVGGATIAMFFAIIAMSRMVSMPNMTLLYAGLEAGAAGDVVQSLEQRGIEFEVRGGSIFVDIKQRDQLRLTLASEGLPANSNNGYELLDSLSGFGTTSQMFDAAYWRAKEGELARTIVASTHISMARVHIATTGSNPFQRGVTPKASVALTAANGIISAQQAKAVRFLVASAVSGLASENVVVIDANGTLLGANDEEVPAITGDDKAQVLRERVQRLLEARVGYGNSVVEVSVETVTESEAIRERSFDPNGRVAISTDTEERSNSATDAGGGDVTVASNLPNENSNGSGDSASNNTETRERINYEVSETEREIIRTPGAIKRLTVAVLVNDLVSFDENQESSQAPRPKEEIDSLRELVSSAVGFDESRGDIITIKSMALQSVPAVGAFADSSLLNQVNIDFMSAIQMVILAIVTLVLGLFVVRPLLSKGGGAYPGSQPALIAQQVDGRIGISTESRGNDQGAEDARFGRPNTQKLPAGQEIINLENSSIEGLAVEDSVERLQKMIGDRQEETVEILRGWLEEKEEKI